MFMSHRSPASQIRPLEPHDQEKVRCGNCGRLILDLILQPGTMVRVKCHCNAWNIISVIAALPIADLPHK